MALIRRTSHRQSQDILDVSSRGGHLVATVPANQPVEAQQPAPAAAGAPGAIRPPLERPGAAAFALGLAGFCCFLGVYATQPLLPTLERVFGVSKAAAALTVSSATIAVALASPFSGWVARRFGHRRVIGGFAGRLLSGLAAERWGWPASFLVLGLVTLAAAAVAVRLLPRSSGPRREASAQPPVRARDVLGEPRLLATFAVGFNVLFTL